MKAKQDINLATLDMRENILSRISELYYSNEAYYEDTNIDVLRSIQDRATINQLLTILFCLQSNRLFKFTAMDYLENTIFLNENNMIIGIEIDGYMHS